MLLQISKHLNSMLYITEWTPKFDTDLLCAHTAHAGEKAYRITIPVCRDHAACLPQMLKAALKQEQGEGQQPSFLYRLWHKWFGKQPKKPSLKQGTFVRMQRCTATQPVRLDCGHTVKKHDPVYCGRLYVCERDQPWEIAVLAVCLFLLEQEKAASQPTPANKTATHKPASPYRYKNHLLTSLRHS